ncbi:MAG: prepilin-type N-terminal cleavage/methylation domain-containing protein [Nitrospirae bacterium]|nr:prepilin-type N-terminal cleavage/methylation domain-containing protein [Nitrospirota bacterium]
MRFTVNNKYGFSLIELIVVIFIMSLAMALIMPSFTDIAGSRLKSAASGISGTMKYVYNEAAARKKIYTFSVNMEQSTWGFESMDESRTFRAGKDIKFKDVMVPSAGVLKEKMVSIDFGPLGPEEPIVIHLTDKEKDYTIFFNNLNGRSRILEGYIL